MAFEISCCFSFFIKKLQNSLSCSCIRSCGMRIRLYSAIIVGLMQRFMAYSTTTRSDSGQNMIWQWRHFQYVEYLSRRCLDKFFITCHQLCKFCLHNSIRKELLYGVSERFRRIFIIKHHHIVNAATTVSFQIRTVWTNVLRKLCDGENGAYPPT